MILCKLWNRIECLLPFRGMLLPPGSFLLRVAAVFAVTVWHAEKLLCSSLSQRPGEEGCWAGDHCGPPRRPPAPSVSLYCLVVSFKVFNWCSSALARGVGLLLSYRGCRCLSGRVFLSGGGGFRNSCGDLECRGRSLGTAELPWGQQTPLGAAAARLLARSRSPLCRV